MEPMRMVTPLMSGSARSRITVVSERAWEGGRRGRGLELRRIGTSGSAGSRITVVSERGPGRRGS